MTIIRRVRHPHSRSGYFQFQQCMWRNDPHRVWGHSQSWQGRYRWSYWDAVHLSPTWTV